MKVDEIPHSPVGPSSFDRVHACPSSAILGAGLDPIPASLYAGEGTVAHTVFATCLADGLDAWEMLDTFYEVGEFEIQVDEEMVEGVQFALDTVRAEVRPGETMEVEQRLELPGTPMFGTTDVVIARRQPIWVADLKYGAGVEVPGDTRQTGLYGLMACVREWRETGVLVGDPDTVLVRSVIIQPRSRVARLKPHDWTRSQLRTLFAEVTRTLADINMRKLRYTVGEHCRFCAAAPVCPQLAATAQNAVMSTVVRDPEVTISAEELDDRLAMLPALKLYMGRLEALGQAYLEAGGQLSAYKLVKKQGRRYWKDEAEAEAWMRGNGITPYDKLRSPRQAELAAPPAVRGELKELAEMRSSGLTIAPADDSRPAIVRRSEAATALQLQHTAIMARRSATNRKRKD